MSNVLKNILLNELELFPVKSIKIEPIKQILKEDLNDEALGRLTESIKELSNWFKQKTLKKNMLAIIDGYKNEKFSLPRVAAENPPVQQTQLAMLVFDAIRLYRNEKQKRAKEVGQLSAILEWQDSDDKKIEEIKLFLDKLTTGILKRSKLRGKLRDALSTYEKFKPAREPDPDPNEVSALQAELEVLRRQVATLAVEEKKLEPLSAQVKELISEKDALLLEIQKSQSTISDLTLSNQQLQTKNAQYKDANSKVQEELRSSLGRYASKSSDHEEILLKLEEINSGTLPESNPIHGVIEDLRCENDRLKKENTELQEQNERLTSENSSLKSKFKKIVEILKSVHKSYKEPFRKVASALQKLLSGKKQIAAVHDEFSLLASDPECKYVHMKEENISIGVRVPGAAKPYLDNHEQQQADEPKSVPPINPGMTKGSFFTKHNYDVHIETNSAAEEGAEQSFSGEEKTLDEIIYDSVTQRRSAFQDTDSDDSELSDEDWDMTASLKP